MDIYVVSYRDLNTRSTIQEVVTNKWELIQLVSEANNDYNKSRLVVYKYTVDKEIPIDNILNPF
ncbi:MAG: hypothetical protein ACRDBY_14180 [Cetobacterium sp.]